MRQTPEVCAATGATYRQLDHWTRQGYVTPAAATTRHAKPRALRLGPGETEAEAARTPGSGNPRWWNDTEVAVVARMVTLVRHGYLPAQAATVARVLVECGEARIGDDLAVVRRTAVGWPATGVGGGS